MAVKTLIIIGRFFFLAMVILQSVLLASFVSEYEDEPDWYAVIILFVPAVMCWWWISHDTKLSLIFIFWTVYIWLGLVPTIGIVFGRIDDKITSKGFWNPITLKVVLSITPLLLILTFHTKVATSKFTDFRRVIKCSVKGVINSCDGIELICVTLNESVCNYGIPKPYKNTLVAFACLNYLWLPFAMAIEYYGSCETRDEVLKRLPYYGIQGILETIFLGLRLGLGARYGVTNSIFISKNIIMAIFYTRKTLNCFDSEDGDSSENEESSGESEAASNTSSAPAQNGYLPVLTTVRPSRSARVAPSAPPAFNPEMTTSPIVARVPLPPIGSSGWQELGWPTH